MSSQSNKPVFTPGYVHIPNLRQKLEWLYARHPSVKTQNKLSKALGVSGSTLSGWLTGTRRKDGYLLTGFYNPDSIPTKYYRHFVDLWGVPEHILVLEDILAFREGLAACDAEPSPWDDLVATLPDNPVIEIVTNATRGISNPDIEADPGLPNLRTGEEIILRVPNPGMRHATLLLHDRSGWSCLRPTPNRPDTEAEEIVVFPRQEDQTSPKFAKIQDPTGMHRILAIFTEQPLPPGLQHMLFGPPIDPGNLNQIAGVIWKFLATGPDACRLITRRFVVSI